MVRRRDMRLPRVDAYYCGIGMLTEFFTQVADGRNGSAGAEFYDYHGTHVILVQEGFEAVFLGAAALVKPGVVFKHQDIGAGDALAARAVRNRGGAHGGWVDIKVVLIRPDGVAAAGAALEVVDGAVHLPYVVGVKACGLKVAIDVGGYNEMLQVEAFDPIFEDGKALVWRGIAVQVGAVAVKAPCKMGITLKMGGIRGLDKAEAETGVHGIGIPEPFVASKVGEAGIHPHPCPGGYHHRIGAADNRA